jgi:hypothetical protein
MISLFLFLINRKRSLVSKLRWTEKGGFNSILLLFEFSFQKCDETFIKRKKKKSFSLHLHQKNENLNEEHNINNNRELFCSSLKATNNNINNNIFKTGLNKKELCQKQPVKRHSFLSSSRKSKY